MRFLTYKIKDLILELVNEMGYDQNYEAGKYNQIVTELFDVQGGFHNDSIYAKLENYSLGINNRIDKVPSIIDIIHLFEGQNIRLPLKPNPYSDALGTSALYNNKDMVDHEGKKVPHETLVLLHSTFDDKAWARNFLQASLNPNYDGFHNLQFPFIDAEYLLQIRKLKKYHKKIRQYIKKYKKALRTLPSYIIVECKDLPELLDKKY